MDLVEKLLALAKKHNFMIFEDRKFADIGNTVKHQYSSGVYKIASWADFTNCHIVPGPGIIEGLREVGLSSDLPRQRALLLLAEMSSKGSLATDSYTDKNVELAKKYDDFAVGFIASRNLSADAPQLIVMTPGVGLDSTGDGLGQQYRTPEKIIGENASDIIIVGRGIIKAKDVAAEAQRYMKHGWDAYLNALKQ
ncbi:orotidine 5'-phosphate decarboxylase [Conidiobolus coronatus NRRL 28638]|jgi:orotidine 5'-phosphate decarboxylase subfamily 1|uniref:Orotidine 5'-phosphate decarboxylase n=1 Tax=Conidiobolus coronatus (strain ATCC 28846 / CBS 209.66 / NRRL 28638) TaxID=796925 RepID=A0A137P4E5_CONC2|nr:orotidine 5'-phosphate decarboxylase [Conidiobolus coronatus NRRL 28638]|eukprot:KXN69784.1 orotidine 5'-phosphate decarboxylase [Conidiobolus coronatus NRRL 28638]